MGDLEEKRGPAEQGLKKPMHPLLTPAREEEAGHRVGRARGPEPPAWERLRPASQSLKCLELGSG